MVVNGIIQRQITKCFVSSNIPVCKRFPDFLACILFDCGSYSIFMNTAAVYVSLLVRSISLCIPACSTHIAFWLVYGHSIKKTRKVFLVLYLISTYGQSLYKHNLIYYHNKLIYIFVQ